MKIKGRGSFRVRLFLLVLTTTLATVKADDSIKNKLHHPLQNHLGLTFGADYVAPSVEDDIREKIDPAERIKVGSSVPVSLRYSFSFTDPSIRNFLPGGYQGAGIGILNFGAPVSNDFAEARHNIGFPVLAYIFQGGPFHHFNSGLSLKYEWNFGASFGWKPYSESNKYFNLTVGSKINAYLNLNMFLEWQVNSRVALFGGVAVSHFSNGNTSFPNPGVNTLGLRLGLTYSLNQVAQPEQHVYDASVKDSVSKKKPEYDLSVWGASRRRVYRGGEEPVLLPGHFACAGISFAPMWRLGTWWRLGGSLDIQWDQSSDKKHDYISGTTTEDIKFSQPDFFRQMSVGLSAHGELQMPIFAVNVGCGVNLYAPKENRGTYQNITLKTYIGPKFFINVGYQLRNFHQQSSLMLGAGLTI